MNFGLVVGAIAAGLAKLVKLVGQISNISLLVQNIDGGLLLGSLLGQSESSMLQAIVFGSLDKDNTQSFV